MSTLRAILITMSLAVPSLATTAMADNAPGATGAEAAPAPAGKDAHKRDKAAPSKQDKGASGQKDHKAEQPHK